MKKTEGRKSRATVPLSNAYIFVKPFALIFDEMISKKALITLKMQLHFTKANILLC
jgi:hypothetical protein